MDNFARVSRTKLTKKSSRPSHKMGYYETQEPEDQPALVISPSERIKTSSLQRTMSRSMKESKSQASVSGIRSLYLGKSQASVLRCQTNLVQKTPEPSSHNMVEGITSQPSDGCSHLKASSSFEEVEDSYNQLFGSKASQQRDNVFQAFDPDIPGSSKVTTSMALSPSESLASNISGEESDSRVSAQKKSKNKLKSFLAKYKSTNKDGKQTFEGEDSSDGNKTLYEEGEDSIPIMDIEEKTRSKRDLSKLTRKERKAIKKETKLLRKMEKEARKKQKALMKESEQQSIEKTLEDLNYVKENLTKLLEPKNILEADESTCETLVQALEPSYGLKADKSRCDKKNLKLLEPKYSVEDMDDNRTDVEVLTGISDGIYYSSPTRTVSTATIQKAHPQKTKRENKLPCVDRGNLSASIADHSLQMVDLEISPELCRREKPKVFAGVHCQQVDHDKYTNDKLSGLYQDIPPSKPPTGIITLDDCETSSITSSIVDFDNLEKLRPWTPVCEEDHFQCVDNVENGPPTKIHYVFEHPDERMYANEQLNVYKFNKNNIKNIKEAKNPYNIMPSERETVGDYCNSVSKKEAISEVQAAISKKIKAKMEAKNEEPRIRRKIEEGSYKNTSVNEKKLKKHNIIRYAWKGKLPKLKKYLQQTPNTDREIDYQDECGRSAVHFAASWDCPQILQVLLDVDGVDVNAQDDEGKTPLYKAVEINSLSCVEKLITYGASPVIKARDNRNPFEYALIEKGDEALNVIKYLYTNASMNMDRRDEGIVTHLHQICIADNNPKLEVLAVAEFLIQSGANINATEGNGRTPLILASQFDNSQLVELFLKYKADALHIDLKLKSALNYATPGEKCYDLIRSALPRKAPRRIRRVEENDARLQYTQKCHNDTKRPIKSNVNNVTYEVKKPISAYQVRVRPTTPNYSRR